MHTHISVPTGKGNPTPQATQAPPQRSITKKNGEQAPAQPQDFTPASTPTQQLHPSVLFVLGSFIFLSPWSIVCFILFSFGFDFVLSLLIKARM